MRNIILACVSFLFGMICYGQNTAEQYMKDPALALQDAKASYEEGNYEKTISLIKIYASLSGRSDGQNLLSNAQQCQQFIEKAKLFKEQGDDSAAAQCYHSILEINPNDKNAKNKVTVSYDEIGDYHSLGIALVRKGNKWGAVDAEKNIVVPIVYDSIDSAWGEGFGFFGPKQTTCIAEREGKTVFVNMNGKEVTPDNLYYAIRGIESDTPNMYYLVYKYNSPEVYVDMNGVEYPTEDEAAYGILGLPKRDTKTSGPYKVGDFYNEQGSKGIVFEVDDSGHTGKIVSLMQDYTDWALEDSEYRNKQLSLYDEYDGDTNFSIIQRISNWTHYFPGFAWCSRLGDGWYLPAKNELVSINDNIQYIDKGLKYAGYRPMRQANYMSSTEVAGTDNKIFYMWGMGGHPGYLRETEKSGCWIVAVKKFGSSAGRITKNDQVVPPRRPSRTIISKPGSIYCDGVYHGPDWEYDYKTTALFESLGSQFNRNFFSISFDYYIQKSDEGYDYEYAKNTNILTLDTGSRAFGLKPWKNSIYAATKNYDNYFDTAIGLEFETWQRIDLVYDNGKLYINGRVLDIGPLTQSSENVLTSVNFASGLCFKGYIKNLIVKSN